MRSTTILAATALLLTACASQTKAVDPSVQPAVAPVATPGAPVTPDALPAVTKDGTSQVACEKGKDHRTLELRTKGKGCELAYTKAGQAAVVAHGAVGVGRCEAALKKIQGKLTTAGFTCK